MVQKLQELGLVTYEPYRGAHLSDQGKTVAIELIRHHRLLESFLAKALGYGWEEVHDEADRLEHYISETFENKIAEWLGHPEFDPHGDPIPDAQLQFPAGVRSQCLAGLRPGTKGTVCRVATQDRDELNLFKQLHLVPGAAVEVLESNAAGLRLRAGEAAPGSANRFLIPLSLAERLFLVEETL
jgi:DtxR family Mn-dependent transcriptional regulator